MQLRPSKEGARRLASMNSRRQIAGSRSDLQTLDNDNGDVVRRRPALGIGLDVALDEFFELHDGKRLVFLHELGKAVLAVLLAVLLAVVVPCFADAAGR